MTIAVAVLGDTYGIIGADGRVLGNDGGIIDDSRDKTLSLPDPLVIGAHAGLMEIAGTPVTTHLGQLSKPAGSDHLESTLASYIAQIEQAVQILPNEQSGPSRHVLRSGDRLQVRETDDELVHVA
jgi:hypothetical protein